jgi:hypothetical protein
MAIMAVIGDLLFHKKKIDDDLQFQADNRLRPEVDRIREDDFANHTDEELVRRVVTDASVTPLEVAFDKAKSEVKEKTVEVIDRFEYKSYGNRPARVDGFCVTKAIPFTGKRDLWDMKTSTSCSSPPRGEIRPNGLGSALVIGIEVPERETDQAEQYIAGAVARVREYLDRQATQIEQFNASLPALVLPLVQQRRARLGKAAELRKRLEQSDKSEE